MLPQRAPSWRDGQCRGNHQVPLPGKGERRAGEQALLQSRGHALQSHPGVQTTPGLVSSTSLWCAGLGMTELLQRFSFLLIHCQPNALGYWLLQTTNAKRQLFWNLFHV